MSEYHIILATLKFLAGGGNILLQKIPSKVEIFNDINKDLITLFRVIQNHLPEFLRYTRWLLVSRDEFNRQMQSSPETLTDIQRAVRFYYLQRNGFAGNLISRTFGYSTSRTSNLNIANLENDLSEIHSRLSRVTIENLPYKDILKRYDRDYTFFYLDPPFHKQENEYGKGIFHESDYAKIAEILSGIKGMFLLSINDTPFIRDVFKNFKQAEASTTYTADRNNNSKKVKELLISNY